MSESHTPTIASAGARSGWGAVNPQAETVHRVAFAGFIATTALACGSVLLGVPLPSAWSWLYAFHIVVALCATLAALARRLPLQNVVASGLALSLTLGMALAMVASRLHDRGGFTADVREAASVASGNSPAAGGAESRAGHSSSREPALARGGLGWQAWPAPLLWTAVLLASRQTVKVLLQPWRRQKSYGWWLLGTSAVLAWLAILVSTPFSDRVMRWWSWDVSGVAWYGVPLAWVAGGFLLVVIFLLVASTWLIPKRRTGRPADFEPVWIWSGLVFWFALADLRAGLWLAAGIGIVAAVAVPPLAWRTLQMPVSPPPGPGASA